MDLNIYTKDISFHLIAKIKQRFKDFKMDVEFHPNFKFDQKNDVGFLPIKLNFEAGHSEKQDTIDFEILTGFELFFNDYDYEEELNETKKYEILLEKKSFFSKLFGKKKAELTDAYFIANEALDQQLKCCNTIIHLNFKTHNKSEMRISLFFAAFLAELTNGVVFDPQNGSYLSGKDALEKFIETIADYENSVTANEFQVAKFDNWFS